MTIDKDDTTANPTITPTRPEDVPALKSLLSRTGLFPAEMLPAMLAPAWAGEAEALWLTCHQGGGPRGFAYCVPEAIAEGTWNMLALAVCPDLQGRGLGAALVNATLQHLRAANHRLLIVETSGMAEFSGARRFYEKIGFVPEAHIRDFWAPGDDKVIYRKPL